MKKPVSAPRRTVFALLLLALVVACGRISIRHDQAPDADFSGLRTYAWIPDPDMLSLHPLARTEENHAWLMAAIDRELAAKGYEKASSGAPDFKVRYAAYFLDQFSTKHRLNTPVNDRATGGYWQPWGIQVNTYDEDYKKGNIIVAVRLPDSEQWLWRGIAEGVVQESLSAEERRVRIDTAIRDILKKFPARE